MACIPTPALIFGWWFPFMLKIPLFHFPILGGDCILSSWAVCFRGSVLELLYFVFCWFQGSTGVCACVYEQPHLRNGCSWYQLTAYWRHKWCPHLWGRELVSCKPFNCSDFKEFWNWISEKWDLTRNWSCELLEVQAVFLQCRTVWTWLFLDLARGNVGLFVLFVPWELQEMDICRWL